MILDLSNPLALIGASLLLAFIVCITFYVAAWSEAKDELPIFATWVPLLTLLTCFTGVCYGLYQMSIPFLP